VGKKILFLGGTNTKISIDRIFLDPKGNKAIAFLGKEEVRNEFLFF